MHNNYYFIHRLSQHLDQLLKGWKIGACFSQAKDELIIGFFNNTLEIYCRANLAPEVSTLSFPQDYARSKKNTVTLFQEILDHEIQQVECLDNERSFIIKLEQDYKLLFKLHGSQANILLFQNGERVAIFRNNISKDQELTINDLRRPIDQSFERFKEVEGDYFKLFPTFGKYVKKWLIRENYEALNIEQQWKLIQIVIEQLENGDFFVRSVDNKAQFVLFDTEEGDLIYQGKDPIEAINAYYLQFSKTHWLERERGQNLKKIKQDIDKGYAYLANNEDKLEGLKNGISYQHIGDILMANLHAIEARSTQVTLHNFYTDEPLKIKLKKDLSPQHNAEQYYRKAKNQRLEIENIEQNIQRKMEELENLELAQLSIQGAESIKEIRKILKDHQLQNNAQKQNKKQVILPYNTFEFHGFDIWIGKNPKANDRLISQYAYKEDLWLHAKDVPGSHILIKQKSGQPFPTDVIEKAASWAAYYSKRKTDSLCPVSVTPRKYIRKTKDLEAGKVIIDREEVILVEPQKP